MAAANQFCGDETGALVGDLGQRTFKFGFAGEDLPKGWIASAVGQAGPGQAGGGAGAGAGDADMEVDGEGGEARQGKATRKRQRTGVLFEGALHARPSDTEVQWARKHGRVDNWDAFEALWSHALEDVLSSDPREHPLLVGVASYESDADRAKQAEVFFERHEVPALFLARNAMLSAFSLGRSSALVVDIGAAKSCAAPVYEGHVLQRSTRTSGVAGDYVDEHLLRLVESTNLSEAGPTPPPADKENSANGGAAAARGNAIRVPCMFHKQMDLAVDGVGRVSRVTDKPAEAVARIRPGYLRWQKQRVLDDLKASVCRVWSELNFDEAKAALYAKERYELPDGTVIYLGADRFKSGELLMHPEADKPFMDDMIKSGVLDVPAAAAAGAAGAAAAAAAGGAPSTPVQPPAAATTTPLSVPHLIRQAAQSAHVDLRRELLQNIILVGGASVLPGTVERLTRELAHVLPGALKPRFLTPGKTERVFSVFTGASVLASLGSFQQLWISKQEWEEYGAAIVAQRCVQ